MAKQPFRLKQGGIVDRSKTLRFKFDGRGYLGYQGDTLASALLANGVKLVGRSFKYHRPRGIYTAGPEEPNALVELRSGARLEPNTKATTIELFDGLEAASQNRWPSLKFDLLSINSLFSPFFGAGFYYKTFMWPASFWERVYEPLIRRSAGLGRASLAARPRSLRKGLRALRCAGHRLRPRGSDGGSSGGSCRRSRDLGRRRFPLWWQATFRDSFNRLGGGARLGQRRHLRTRNPRQCAVDAAHHRLRGLRWRHLWRGGTCQRCGPGSTRAYAAPAQLAHLGEAGGAGVGRDRARHRVSRQRSSGCDAGIGGEDLSHALRRGAGQARRGVRKLR